MPKVRNDNARSTRQDPVSCDSCRSKKLKCDRASPCSNCKARKLECVYHKRSQLSEEDSDSLCSTTSAAILERLQRLEKLVLPVANQKPEAQQQSTTRTPTVQNTDYQWLESVDTRENTIFNRPQERIDVRTGPNVSCDSIKHITLPPLQSATVLFEDYARLVNPLQHVVHIPSCRQTFERVYAALAERNTGDLGSTAPLLAIFASVANTCLKGSEVSYRFDSTQEAAQACVDWTNAAMDALEYSRRLTPGKTEDVQATVLLVFLLYQNEGFTSRVRVMHANGYTIARQLGLHRTDTPNAYSKDELHQWQIIEIETKRRLWWHLATTDWLLSFSGGPSEGVYSIQKQHMSVEKPRNITDEDLATQPFEYSRPLDEPTPMGYYFHRIRLGELCKDIADSNWSLLATSDPNEAEYEEIIELDKRFKKLSRDLPTFLRLDRDSSSVDHEHPYIIMQRYFTNLSIHGRRCKFNMPFMLRVSQNELFKYSREVCLRSARYVLELSRILENEMFERQPLINMKSVAVIHLVFYATTVLVMDLCVNKHLGEEAEKREEASKACQVLERARENSSIARAFLDSLMSVLRKHNVGIQLRGKDSVQSTDSGTLNQNTRPTDNALPRDTTEFAKSSEFGLWQDYFDYAPQDAQFWDYLFSEIDMKLG